MYDLNTQQQALVDAPFDHEIVGIAGAGTGKTTTIMARAARFLKEKKAGRLLLVTFTRLAAREMQERLAKEVDDDEMRRVEVGTFHSIIARLIRQNATVIGIDRDFTILDSRSAVTLYKQSISMLDRDDLKFLKKKFGKKTKRKIKNEQGKVETIVDYNIGNKEYGVIASSCSKLINVARITELDSGLFEADTIRRVGENVSRYLNPRYEGLDYVNILYKIFLRSIKLAIEADTMSYDQILFFGYLMTKKSAQTGKSVLNSENSPFAYVIVDEYQDTSPLQDFFVNSITNGNLTVVGDIDQAIYEFRGGTTKLLEERARKARETDPNSVINLTYNYRSYQPILDAANSVIGHNQSGQDVRKPLSTLKNLDSQFDGVTHVHAFNESKEAEDVFKRIRFLHNEKGIPYSKMAVLVRSRMALAPFSAKVKSQKKDKNYIPFNDMTNFSDVLESDNMNDVLNYLTVLTTPKNGFAFEAILDRPKRGIGPVAINLLKKLSKENHQSLVQFVLSDNIDQLSKIGQKSLETKIRSFTAVYRDLIKQSFNAANGKLLKPAVSMILQRSGYLAWINGLNDKDKNRQGGNLEQIKTILDQFEDDYRQQRGTDYNLFDIVNAFLTEVKDMAKSRYDKDGVVINTIHGVKGLEYDEVFLIGANYTIMERNGNEEEERRLMYVALTRAKRGLVVYSTDRRLGQADEPSTFVKEMGDVNKIDISDNW